MQFSRILKSFKAFLISVVTLTIAVGGMSLLRNNPEYVDAFDIIVLVYGIFTVMWVVVLWWRYRRQQDINRGFMAGRLRFILLMCVLAPFIYLFITAANDITARRMSMFTYGVDNVRSSADVHEIMGGPIAVGWPVRLSGEYSSDSGHAVLLIPVIGSRSKAAVYVDGLKNNGSWLIKDIYLVQDGTKTQTIPISSPAN